MKKTLAFIALCALILTVSTSCAKKPKQLAPPPPPQVKEQPKVEKVVEPPAIQKPKLTEEELFMSKTLEQINKEGNLKSALFDYDKYFIRQDAKSVLEANAAWLKKFKTGKILIEGHCDERGTEDYNLALGERRAKSAQEYLLSLGIPGDRMKIISYGKSQPVDPGHDAAAWQKNRRAQFTVIEK